MTDARTITNQIANAREHLAEAVYYAGEVGAKPHKAVDEIDAALRLLYTAREQIVADNMRRRQPILDQYDAYDTYRPNILAAIPPDDHETGMCFLSGCTEHRDNIAAV